MKKLLIVLLAAAVAFMTGWIVGRWTMGNKTIQTDPTECDTITTESLVPEAVTRPLRADSVKGGAGHVTARLPKAVTKPPVKRKTGTPDRVADGAQTDTPEIEDDAGEGEQEQEADSADVTVPLSSYRYSGENFEAWVSGYNARLDSIRVYARVREVRVKEKAKRKRWSVGLQAGYGFTPKGWQPYIGVGVSVKLFEF